MELLSQKFRYILTDLMARPHNLLAATALEGIGSIEQLKGRNDIELVRVTRENREILPAQIATKILESMDT